MKPGGQPRTVREGMDKLVTWMWDTWQMPAREVKRLTPREAHGFLEQGLQKRANSR